MRHDRPGAISLSLSLSLSRPHGAFPVVSEGHDSCGRFQESTGAGARAVSGGDERQQTRERRTRGRGGRTRRRVLSPGLIFPVRPTLILSRFCWLAGETKYLFVGARGNKQHEVRLGNLQREDAGHWTALLRWALELPECDAAALCGHLGWI